MNEYQEFLKNKIKIAPKQGFPCSLDEINPRMKPHNRLMVKWMVEGGRPPSITSGIPANQSRLPYARKVSIRSNYHVHLNNNQWKEKVLSFTGVFMKG